MKNKLKEKIKLIVGGIFVLISILFTLRQLRSQDKKDFSSLDKIYPIYRDIVNKKVIFGKIAPLKEVKIIPQISGILEKLYIEEGKKVKKNTPLARISPLHNPKILETSKSQYNLSKNKFNLAQKEYDRAKKLIKEYIISKKEFQSIENKWIEAKENLDSAKKNYDLHSKGYYRGQENEPNIVKSTIDGTVLELPFKEGSSVMERYGNYEGSTIAIIADMNDIIFTNDVNEKEAASLHEGMKFDIKIQALDLKLPVILTKISPKGKNVDGITKFRIEAKVINDNSSDKMVRAGYKAIAEIVLEEKKNVLSIEEKFLKFENEKPFVYVKKNGKKIKKDIEIGISDDIYVEIKKGLTDKDRLFVEKKYD